MDIYPFNTVIYHLLYSHNVVAYSKVLELAAEDRDIGENAQLTFSVVAGDQEQKFYIVSHKQEQRGTLRLKKRLDFERHSEQRFNLTLKVRIQMVVGVVSSWTLLGFILIWWCKGIVVKENRSLPQN